MDNKHECGRCTDRHERVYIATCKTEVLLREKTSFAVEYDPSWLKHLWLSFNV